MILFNDYNKANVLECVMDVQWKMSNFYKNKNVASNIEWED